VKYQFFPRSQGITDEIYKIIQCFINVETEINSINNKLNSDEVLEKAAPFLLELGYKVESGKKSADKIRVPVLFGLDNNIDKEFNADALSNDGKIVIEIEAGRALDNNQFLKRYFSSLHDVWC